MKILDRCKQIIDTESGRVLLYRDEVEAVLTAGDTISRRQAIDALGDEPEVWSGKDEYAQGLNNQWHYDRNAIKALPSAQPQDIARDIATIIENEQDMRAIAKNAQSDIILCKDCKYWRRQTNYAGAPLSFGFCESDDMWRSLYGETYEVSHIDTDDDFYCGYAERREE